jgi:hypothetical protein
MKVILSIAALSAVFAGAAFAQSTTTAPKTNAMPSQTYTLGKTEAMFYAERGEWRASKLIGTSVTNQTKETIGDINEVLIDKDGKVAAVIIGIGGFLGMGERHAAVSFSALQMSRDANNNALISVNVTKEQLKASPEWTWRAASAN